MGSFGLSIAIIRLPANIRTMKQWRRFFQSVFIRHIDGPETVIPVDSIYQPMVELDVLRFVVLQHLQAAQENEQLIVAYSEYQTLMMDQLRFEGCEVTMQVNAKGELCYLIATSTSGKAA
jgi:hypothetical protein